MKIGQQYKCWSAFGKVRGENIVAPLPDKVIKNENNINKSCPVNTNALIDLGSMVDQNTATNTAPNTDYLNNICSPQNTNFVRN